MIGFAGKYYSIPQWKIVWGIFFAACLIMTILDIFHTISTMSMHPGLLFLAFLNNLIDGVVELAFAVKFFAVKIPLVTQYALPYLANSTYVFFMGAFLVATSVFWLVMMPFTR